MSKWIFTIGCILASTVIFAQEKLINDANAETRTVGRFHGIAASGDIDVYISQGPQNVAISAEKKEDVPNIITEVKDGILHIRYKNRKGWWSDQWNTMGRKYRAYISAEEIGSVGLSGSGNIYIEGRLSSPKLKLEVSGSGNISGAIDTRDLEIRQSGSSNIRLSGSAGNAEFVCSGSGNIISPDLATDMCKLRMSGSGNAEITVNKELTASVSGSGNIRYRGAGNLVSSNTSGSGSIRKI